MTKSKKNSKKVANVENAEVINTSVTQLLAIARNIENIDLPIMLNERFDGQLTTVMNRIGKIAANLQKAIELEATKDEREVKKTERVTKRRTQLEAQLAAVQAKLSKLDS